MPKHTLGAFLWHFVLQYRWLFIGLLVAHWAWSIDQVLMPYAFKIFLERITHFTGDRAEAWPVLAFPILLGIGLWVLTEIMFRLYDFWAVKTYPAFEAKIRTYIVEYVQQHSFRFFSDHFAGDIASKISDMPQSATRIMQLILTLFSPAILAFIAGLSIFASMHPLFALVLFLWYLQHIGVCVFFAEKFNQLSETHSSARSTLTGRIIDSFNNFIAVKSFAAETQEREHISNYQYKERKANERVLKATFWIRLYQGTVCFFIMGIAMTWLMIVQWQAHIITGAEFTYLFYTSWGLTVMAWICGMELPNFFKEVGVCQQALALIQKEHEITDAKKASSLQVSAGEVAFDKVGFMYRKNTPLFDNLSVTIAQGSKVGLVGFSGSGKTSFVNLILRFYELSAGAITIDSQAISNVTMASLRSHISMIPQDPTLFHRSVMENIRFGKADASDEEVIAAAKSAHCHAFIEQLENGYDTMVGERGIKLSGGQRQRIAIARAILKNAPILILDEATSALDSVTEAQIQDSLNHLMQGKTTIIVAHRLSTLSHMDRILVFDQGKIIEDGTHESLLEAQKHYHKMWQMQAGGFLPE